MSKAGASFSHVSYHVGAEWRVRCNTYSATTPIFCMDTGSSTISVTTQGNGAGKAAVEFARAFAREAQRFAVEMERMHAAHLDGDGKAAGSDAA